jgi:hypothetical protein
LDQDATGGEELSDTEGNGFGSKDGEAEPEDANQVNTDADSAESTTDGLDGESNWDVGDTEEAGDVADSEEAGDVADSEEAGDVADSEEAGDVGDVDMDAAVDGSVGEDSGAWGDAENDAGPMQDTEEGADIEEEADIEEDGDAPSQDVETPSDIAEEDAGGPEPLNCDPTGYWQVVIDSAALPGEGCQGGNPGQSESTHIFDVKKLALTGELVGTVIAPVGGGGVEQTLLVVETNEWSAGCGIQAVLTVSIYLPPLNEDSEAGYQVLQYDYTLHYDETKNAVGGGTVHTEFQADSGAIENACTEDISVEGAFYLVGP